MKLSFKAVNATNKVLFRDGQLRRWTSHVSSGSYSELSKQALNSIVTYMLAIECEHAGKKIKWERFPKIALYRAFQKAYVNFDTPEYILNEICEMSGIEVNCFDEVTKNTIEELTDSEFAEFISEGNDSYELRIYQAATKVATYVELVENQLRVNGSYSKKATEIIQSLKSYEDIPGVKDFSDPEGNVFGVLRQISKLRHQNRWAVQPYLVECPVLGHLFDTAVFAYFMSLEQNPEDEKLATQMFFMGIFHDVAEQWTKDIPSPIKDKIPGFRKATEVYELRMIEVHMYKELPDYLEEAIRKVMFEDESNIQYKKLLKGADYLSADSECWRQYMAGTRDWYFRRAVENRRKKIESGEVLLTPVCRQLYKYFVKCVQNIQIEDSERFKA